MTKQILALKRRAWMMILTCFFVVLILSVAVIWLSISSTNRLSEAEASQSGNSTTNSANNTDPENFITSSTPPSFNPIRNSEINSNESNAEGNQRDESDGFLSVSNIKNPRIDLTSQVEDGSGSGESGLIPLKPFNNVEINREDNWTLPVTCSNCHRETMIHHEHHVGHHDADDISSDENESVDESGSGSSET